MDRRKPTKSPAPAKKKSEAKPAVLYEVNQVLAFKEDGVVELAVAMEEVAPKAKVILAKRLMQTQKYGRYCLGDDLSLASKAVLGKVEARKKGKNFDIAKKNIPESELMRTRREALEEQPPSNDEAEEEEAPAAPVKTRTKSTPPPAKSHKKKVVEESPEPKVATRRSEPKSVSPKPSPKAKPTKAVAKPAKPAAAKTKAKPVEAPAKRAAAKKPVYEESSDSEEEKTPPKKRKAKKEVEEASDFSEGDSEKEREKPKKGGKKKKLCDVQKINLNEEVASEERGLDVRCCIGCNDRNVIRAGLTSSLPLFKGILASDKTISSLHKFHGPELKRTGLFYAFQSANEPLIRAFISELRESKMVHGYKPVPGLAYVGTGHVSKEAFGVQVRMVNMSRGGREGNNALLYPEYGQEDIATIAVKLVRRGISTDLLNLLFTVCPETDNWLSNSVGDAVRTGDLALALHMVQIYNKKGGFGFNFLHEGVLKKAKLPEFKKVSVTKKVLGNSCIAPLHCACINPDPSHLEEMLPMVDNIGYEDLDKWKAVHYAAVCTSAEPMKVLCDHGVNINDLNKDKTTPLMLAAKRNRAEVAEFLLKRGANIDMKSRKGKAAIHFAAQYNSLDALKVILKFLTKKTLEMPGPEKMTALIVAATKGHLQAVEMLLEAGAGVKKRDKQRRTALLQAVKNGHADIASVLLAHGADPNDPDSSKNAPLHYSCAYGWWQCTDLLLACQANVNATNDWKLPPLLIALLKGHFGLMKHLLEVPGVDVNCKDEEGRTLLSRSVDMLSRTTIEQMEDLLKNRNADPNIPDLKGMTPMHHLASRGKPTFPGAVDTPKEEIDRWIDQEWSLQEEAATLLLTYGGNINAESEEKLTPVLLSLHSRNSRLCRFFLQKGAAIQLTTKDGSNILHATAALDADLFPIVRDLLQMPEVRQHVNAVNDDGFTPLLSFCKKFQLEGQQVYSQINSRIRAEMIEEAKKQPQVQGNEFLAGITAPTATLSFGQPATLFGGHPAFGGKTLFAGGLPGGGYRQRQRARFQNFNQTAQAAVQYYINEAELLRRTNEEFEKLAEGFAGLLKDLVQSGANPKSHVEKLKKYRDDPQIIKIEYEENRSKEEVLKSQQTMYFGQPQSTRTFFVKDFDGSSLWNEYNEDGLKAPLHFLLAYPHAKLITESLTLHLDLNQRDFSGETALHKAVRLPGTAYTNELLVAGADPNVRNCKGQTPLHHACGTKNPSLVLELLRHRAEAEFLDVDGTFPLKIAVEAKDSATVRTLLENGVNPNFCDGKKRTALHHAFNSADVTADASFDLESLLLEAGADINLPDVRNRTPLHYAFVKIGKPDLNTAIDPVETVSSACGMKGVNPNVQDAWGRTPLHYAAQRGSVTSAIIMIEAGADVMLKDSADNTSFGVSLANSHSEFATMLLQHKIDISIPVVVQPKIKKDENQVQQGLFGQVDLNDYTYNCYGQKRQGATQGSGGPLAVGTYSTFRAAVKQNWLGVAYLLLYRGYDYMRAMQDAMNEQKFQLCLTLLAKVTDSAVVRKSNEENQNLFHTLALYGAAADQEVTQALGAKLHLRKVDYAQKDNAGCQPLHIACSSQYPALVSFLLNLGANVNAPDEAKKTPVVHAIEGKRVLTALPTLQVLTQADFNVKFHNEDGLVVTPIIHAVMQSAAKEVVLFLLNAGADITARDGLGRNLLVHAIKKNSMPLVEAILGFPGLDMKCVDELGWTYVHHVVCPLDIGSYENEDILDKLAKAHVALSVPDKSGHTPYYYACKQRSGAMRAALEALDVKEKPTQPETEAEFHPASEVDFHADFEEYLKTKADDMEVEEPAVPDPAGDFPTYYEVVENFDLLMVRVDLAYGPFSAYLFYRMQLLRDKNRDVYVLFTRWGRIGETGAFQRTPFSTRDEGENEFKKVFREKTKNDWGSEFKHVKGKYRLLNIKKKHVEHKQFLQLFDFVKAPPVTVKAEVQSVLKQLTDTSVYTSVFNNSQINMNVLNFDNIGKSDLMQAEDLLCEIGSVIQTIRAAKTNEVILDFKEKLYDLSSRFYEIIPMTSFLHAAVVPIQQDYDLKAKMDMLESLRNVEVASKIILGALHRQEQVNPYDYCYNALHMLMDPLDQTSAEFKLLKQYAENGGNTYKIVNAFRIERAEEAQRIRKHEDVKNRMLLWHGSALTNMMGIFTQGLKIAPPEAPATGYMFGKGIYFADLFSKSIQYCSQGGTNPTNMFIMLAEVVLGKSLEKLQGENIEKLPHGYQSVKGIGREGPDYSQSVFLENGICVPCGPRINYPQPEPGTYIYLQHNEYIVYNVNQVRLRYLVELKI